MPTRLQIILVKASFAIVAPAAARAGTRFYSTLFEIAPEVRPLFRGDLVAQGAKIMKTLGAIVDELDRLDRLLPVARDLARRHVAYGVLDHHYAAVGEALLLTMRAELGAVFTPEVEAAWRAAYATLSDAMIGETRRIAA